MKLNLRFRHSLFLLAVFCLDPAFTRFVYKDEDDPALRLYLYGMLAVSTLLLVLTWRWFSPAMRRWALLVLACLGGLSLESYAGWGSWAVYPHVFGKLMALLLIFGVYAYYRRRGLPPGLGVVLSCLPLVVVLNLAIYEPASLTLGGFLHHERGINVTSAFFVVLTALYLLNRYLSGASLMHLLGFFAALGFIVFMQHRTVWLCTGLSLGINLLLLPRMAGTRLTAARIMPIFALPTVLGLLGGLTLVLGNPAVLAKFAESLDDIRNPTKQGTASWRLLQFESYEPFIREYPLLGMRLKGFELPIQFYSPDSGEPVWPDFTGHHFHSFYIDRLFYFGALGLLLVLGPLLFILVRRVLQARQMPPLTVALVAYSVSGLLYGFSYDWPPYFFGLLGLMLAAIELAVPVTQPQQLAAPAPAASFPTAHSAPVYA